MSVKDVTQNIKAIKSGNANIVKVMYRGQIVYQINNTSEIKFRFDSVTRDWVIQTVPNKKYILTREINGKKSEYTFTANSYETRFNVGITDVKILDIREEGAEAKEIQVFAGQSAGQMLPLEPNKTYRFKSSDNQISLILMLPGGASDAQIIDNNATFTIPSSVTRVTTWGSMYLEIYEIPNGGEAINL